MEENNFLSLQEDLSDALVEFLSFSDFQLSRISKTNLTNVQALLEYLDNEKGIIIKTLFEFIEDRGIKIPSKSYYLYLGNEDDVKRYDKRSISKSLKEKVVAYINENQSLPDAFTIEEKRVTKKGIVSYELVFSQYISFNISIKPSDLEVDDVSLHIIELPINKSLRPKKRDSSGKSESWKVEYAKSSRARCRICDDKIMKGEIRLGQPSYYQEHLSYKWHHLDCNKNFKTNYTILGLEDFSEEDQELIMTTLDLLEGDGPDRDPKQVVEQLIVKLSDNNGLTAKDDVLKHAGDNNITVEDVENILRELEEEGKIYYPEPNKINLI